MATLRRGLPRTRGGEGWPPAGVVAAGIETEVGAVAEPVGAAVADTVTAVVGERAPAEPPRDETRHGADDVSSPTPAASSLNDLVGAATASTPSGAVLRRGLPRVAGGEPWPPAGAAGVLAAASPVPELVEESDVVVSEASKGATTAAVPVTARTSPAAAAVTAPAQAGFALRRGLPRVVGGEPWPPAGTAAVVAESVVAPAATEATVVAVAQAAPAIAVAPLPDVSAPLPFTRTVWNGSAPRRLATEPAASKLRPTWPQAIGGLFAAAGLAVLAGAAIAIVRAFLSLPFMQDFLTTYPGEYHLPAGAPVGIPGWIGWQHFFNVFLMTLIIRSGLRVRSEKRPTAFWTPRGNPKGKISLTLWFHQGLDLLWIVNGVIFVVLLFVTGQWMRIVPTSWDVFPNALSALLQYVSFDWPTENGWVNYNSLQQLAYFTIVFLAAPVAIATGFRMSGLWPKKAEGLSKAYPIEIARAVHFPTMLFFTAFIVVHVALVLLTGMLRNLNHMFAAQDAVTWTGFWVFVLSLVVIAGGWVAARPLVLAPIAKMFGQVSGR
ncbi:MULTISPECIES: cytochrome b/b6 domain-containing protein [unclassified Microbacterium]|uniref:cytochrome b/b6 domain-containing protein n=1 Tax=unclassified Microbacterium TaxID=2609290 RepID=UPI003662FFC3